MKPGKISKKQTDKVSTTKIDNLNGSGHDVRHRIAETAYELYEQRGRADGYDLDDWFKAEAGISGKKESGNPDQI